MDDAVERREDEVAFNFAYRVLGSEADAAGAVQAASGELGQGASGGEPSSGLQLLAATRRACHNLASRRRPPPAGSSEEDVAAASMRLPIRQREALALRELGQLSYVEIAEVMETGDNAVAQLISRARINLSDELRGTVLASIAAPSPECERALPLIAMRDDGQLSEGSPEAAWLDAHLTACERCRLGIGAMREAGASYASWAPIATPAGLLGAPAKAVPADAAAAPAAAPEQRRRRRLALAAALASLLLLVGIAAASLRDDAAPPLDPAAEAAPPASAAAHDPEGRAGKKEKDGDDRKAKRRKADTGGSAGAGAADTAAAAEPATIPVTSDESAGEPAARQQAPPGAAAVEPTQRTPASSPSRKPKPEPTATAPQPAPAPAPEPVSEEPAPPVSEEPTTEPPRRREPPGKPAGKPSK